MSNDPSTAAGPSRYVVGIDLGTTNSAMTYVDTSKKPWRVRTFAVPQVVAPAQVEARETLPSFHYQPAVGELASAGTGASLRSATSHPTIWPPERQIG